MIDWDDMRVFLGVARARSLSGAAPGLRMDPATVGRRIARLEESRGAAPLHHSPHGDARGGHQQGGGQDPGGRLVQHASDS